LIDVERVFDHIPPPASMMISLSKTLATSRKRLQRLVRSYRILLILVVAASILYFGRSPGLYLSDFLPQHAPGRLGNFLLDRNKEYTKPKASLSWNAEFFNQQTSHSLFTWDDRDDRCEDLEAPREFDLGDDQKHACWRLRLMYQLDAWKPHKSFR
jgi:hypothetical protein